MSLKMLQAITENKILSDWQNFLERRPDQINQIHETDAEIVPLPDSDNLLATTIDTVFEEIAYGFYQQPETIGWMGAMVSLSDLAAVGAKPLGIVTSVNLPKENNGNFQQGVAKGLNQACRALGTYVLGGDTNYAESASITTCALGIVPKNRLLKRKGAKVGDLVYTTGGLGAGSAAAARGLLGLDESLYAESDYRPMARIFEAQHLIGFASSCMDTSDGLINTLDQLMRINELGFEITAPLEGLLDPKSKNVCSTLGMPPLIMFCGNHGEFELIFTIPQENNSKFLEHAEANNFNPILVGRTIEEPVVQIAGDPPRIIDTTKIRNLLEEAGSDLKLYLAEMTQIVAQVMG
jgi:thiamine-monophosphate kinase